MKMSKYENNVFPHSCTFYCKPSCTDVESHKCYFNIFSPYIQSSSIHILTIIIPERNLFFQNYMTNVVKTDKLREELSTSYFVMQSPKLELILRNFLLNMSLVSRKRNFMVRSNKYAHFFYFYVLRKLSRKLFLVNF